MKSVTRFVEPGLAVLVVAFFGLMTASNAGVDFRTAPTGLVDDATAAGCLGGACPESGGSKNCGRATHTCGTAGCTATTAVCTWSGSQCIMLGQLSTPSTFPCSSMQGAGSCQAYYAHQCLIEQWGPGASFYSCNYGDTYCNKSSYCGEALYLDDSPPNG